MNLKKIILNNIRSYENQEIVFPEGNTLMSGDIGSGKTSILLGIEFALFGLQPGQRGSSLLRNGETQGGAKIEFEVDGKEILIERTLKKGKSISQDYCAITVDGFKEEVAVTQLKNKVLELLNYPKEFSKKQNILYRFTVFTPQEEMKQIILQDPETRINTLRHVFGIDKYKRILENVSLFSSRLREERRVKEGLTGNLEQDKLDFVSKENDLESKRHNLGSVEKELFLKSEVRKKIEEEKKEISKKLEEKSKFQQEVEKTKIVISTKKETINSNIKIMKEISEQIYEMQKNSFDESRIYSLEREIISKKSEKEKLMEESLEISSKINSLQIKNSENEKVKSRITSVDLCPTCLQDVNPNYKSNVVNSLDSTISQNNSEIRSLNIQKIEIKDKTLKLDSEINSLEEEFQNLKLMKVKLENLNEKKLRLSELENTNLLFEKDIEILSQHNTSLENAILELRRFEKTFELKQDEFQIALREERMAEITVAELKKEIDVFSKQIEELKQKISVLEQTKKELDYIVKMEEWISKKFIPLMTNIEKNVMVKLKAEFSKLFSEWFGMLVSDSFNVRLTDDFTPIVEFQDYELDYSYLSGGERTAIALAYRLSLNQVINSLLSKIKTKDLVILDEPTDGFSDQQLDKMRDVLQQLDVTQMIIVSHEQKMESFVDNVIKLKKSNGVSQTGD